MLSTMSSKTSLKRASSSNLNNSVITLKKRKVTFANQREEEVQEIPDMDIDMELDDKEYEQVLDVLDLLNHGTDTLEELSDKQLMYTLIMKMHSFHEQDLELFSKKFNYTYDDSDFERYDLMDQALKEKELEKRLSKKSLRFVIEPAKDDE